MTTSNTTLGHLTADGQTSRFLEALAAPGTQSIQQLRALYPQYLGALLGI